ncbi:MAG: type II toxin-antitoxin system PemK/MazF family toxin [Candidatus Magasanikbacteria bacterium]|nr:type II toxin-antitoxin system PemK/MazF family toxin [Candidatus Magasanikbacteria bacterium]
MSFEKDFDSWNTLKQDINKREWKSFVQDGDIWFCSVGVNVGVEEDGKNNNFERPVLVMLRLTRGYFWGVPLTSSQKNGFYSFPLVVKEREVTALLMQFRMFDCKRLRRKVGAVPPSQLAIIKQRVTDILWKNKRPQLSLGPRRHSE